MIWRELGGMVATLLPVVASPGASLTLTLGRIAAGDRRGPRRVALGTSLGTALIAVTLGATGLGAVIIGSPVVLTVFAVLGGCVLVGMGVRAIASGGGVAANGRPARAVRTAFLAVVVNPKALSVYLFVAPQAMPIGDALSGYLWFAAVHIALMFLWLPSVGAAARRIPGLAESMRWRRRLAVGGGAYLVVLGLGLWIGELC